MSRLPPEIWDQIALHAFDPDLKDSGLRWACHLKHSFNRYKELADIAYYTEYIGDLLALRLVSKTTCASTTRALARLYQLKISPFQESLGDNAAFLTSSQLQSDGISLLNNIRHLKLGFIANGGYQLDYDQEMIFVESKTRLGGNSSRFSRCDGILNRLSKLIARQKAIESIEIRLCSVFESEYWGSEDDCAPQVDLGYHESIINTLTSALQQPLDHLVDLRLILPCTRDFDRLNTALSDSTLAQLRHLYLGVADATGSGGSIDYTQGGAGEASCAGDYGDYGGDEDAEDDDEDDEDSGPPSSNLQLAYPNRKYMQSLLRLVSRSPNLQSLGISCTHMLNLRESDAFTWTPAAAGLETIVLSRVRASPEALIRLLSPAPGHTSALRQVWLYKIHLTTGCWHTVFQHLYDHASTHFELFQPEQLCYSRAGESSHFRMRISRLWENTDTMWTRNPVDEEMLEQLAKKINVVFR